MSGIILFPRSPSAAPVAGRSLAGQASQRVSPRYKVSPMVEESKIKHELCSLRAYAVIVCRNWKLIDKRIGILLFQILSLLQFYGHPSLIIAQVPDTFSQHGINYRPDFILSAPDGIEVSHNILSSVPGSRHTRDHHRNNRPTADHDIPTALSAYRPDVTWGLQSRRMIGRG